jgi:hypothetical protein
MFHQYIGRERNKQEKEKGGYADETPVLVRSRSPEDLLCLNRSHGSQVVPPRATESSNMAILKRNSHQQLRRITSGSLLPSRGIKK